MHLQQINLNNILHYCITINFAKDFILWRYYFISYFVPEVQAIQVGQDYQAFL